MTVLVRLIPLAWLALLAPVALAQQPFPSPDAAAEALVTALGTQKHDEGRLAVLFGPNWHEYSRLAVSGAATLMPSSRVIARSTASRPMPKAVPCSPSARTPGPCRSLW